MMVNSELIRWLQRFPDNMEVRIRAEMVDLDKGKVLVDNCPIGLVYEYNGEGCIVIEGWDDE